MKLIEATLDREIVTPKGERISVRSPSVFQALALIGSLRGFLTNDPSDRDLWYSILESWLPERLFLILTEAERELCAHTIISVLTEESDRHERTAEASSVDWDDLIAEFMAEYGYTLGEVMAEKWSGFLVLSSRIDMVRARRELRLIHTRSLPYIKNDAEREEAIESIKIRARLIDGSEEAKEKRRIEKQKENLSALSSYYRHEINPGAA